MRNTKQIDPATNTEIQIDPDTGRPSNESLYRPKRFVWAQTVNKIKYDTEKARFIGHANNIAKDVDSQSDGRYWSASLYKTLRSGRFFLAGRGNAMSRFGKSCGVRVWTAGAGIEPLTQDEAYNWAEKYLDPEIVEQEFSDIIKEA